MQTQSDLLRKRHTRDGGGKNISSKKSKKQEHKVTSSTKAILTTLQAEYPTLDFYFEKAIMLSAFRKNIENEKSYISPDGGFIFVRLEDGKKICVFSSESKHQGTNDKRIAEGLKPQAKGNAIERAHKNFNEIDLLLESQKTFPFLVCCSGYDFHDGSTIRDRAGAMSRKSPFNTIYVNRDEHGRSRASVMLRQKRWEAEEIVEMGLRMSREVIKIELDL